jgi:hypothetical protein
VTGPNGKSVFLLLQAGVTDTDLVNLAITGRGHLMKIMRPLACFLAWMKIMSFGSVLQNWTDVSQFL